MRSFLCNHKHIWKLVLGVINMINKHITEFKIIRTVDATNFWLMISHLCEQANLGGGSLAQSAAGIYKNNENWLIHFYVSIHQMKLNIITNSEFNDITLVL